MKQAQHRAGHKTVNRMVARTAGRETAGAEEVAAAIKLFCLRVTIQQKEVNTL